MQHQTGGQRQPAGRTRRVPDEGAVALYRSRIESVGAYLPEREVTSAELVGTCAHTPGLDLEGITGIRKRHVCSPMEDALSLASAAVRDCLAHSTVVAEDLELVVFCGISRFDAGPSLMRFEPGMSVLLREMIGATRAQVFDLGNACAGMTTGVHVVSDFIRRGAAGNGLVVSGEFITHISRNAAREVTDPKHLQAASLTVGDAGAAVILTRAADDEQGIQASFFTTQAQHVDLCIGGPYAGGAGGQMLTHSREIHEAGTIGTPLVVQRLLHDTGLSMTDIDLVIVHQTAVRAIDRASRFISELLGGDPSRFLVNVDRCGNTASTSHFVALRRCLEEGRLEPGNRVMLLAQASGLVLGGMVFTVGKLGERYVRMH